MRLKKIKLVGFKSFVDPTSIAFPGNLMGIVGPNGCGKSNIVDAVKWVMGEVSAKSLRGETMADVIFSGSTSRKLVGAASVELVFDNREGKLGGQYAAFNEISVRRMVSRDGSSEYGLNGTRCRRRDIIDVFLGTGLGVRSYAIIEQGMVSKLIEAKPDELRVYLEEAAGISKYKERRRETESRILRTRDNLERLTDLKEELEKQLNHLKRQSEAAEKYRSYKQDERKYKAELLALRWQGLDGQATQRQQVIHQKESIYESAVADQRELETSIEKTRLKHVEASEVMNTVQSCFYQHGAEITRLEAAVKHAQETRQQQQAELERLEKQLQYIITHLEQDKQSLRVMTGQLETSEPRLQQARSEQQAFRESLSEAEAAMQSWQRQWQGNQQELSMADQSIQVEITHIDHMQRHMQQLNERLQVTQEELTNLGEQSLDEELQTLQALGQELAAREAELQTALQSRSESLAEQRTLNSGLVAQQDDLRESLQSTRAQLATLQSVQKAAYGGENEHVSAWIDSHNLSDAPRLAQRLEVEAGWGKAVEAVLGHYLEAVSVADDVAYSKHLNQLASGRIGLITQQFLAARNNDDRLLISRIKSDSDLSGLLHDVYISDDLDSALVLRKELPVGASVVTRDGICLGQNWIRVSVGHDKEGILEREQRIKYLEQELVRLEQTFTEVNEKLRQGREIYMAHEQQREEIQSEINDLNRQLVESRAEINGRENILRQLAERDERLAAEVLKIQEQMVAGQQELQTAEQNLKSSKASFNSFKQKSRVLESERERFATDLQHKRDQSHVISDQTHQIEMQIESLRSQHASMQGHQQRMQHQQQNLEQQRIRLQQSINDADTPLDEMQVQRNQLLEQRQAIEVELAEARNRVEQISQTMRELEISRHQAEQRVKECLLQAEKARMMWQEVRVKCQGIAEQLTESGYVVQDILKELHPEASESAWSQKLECIEKQIIRLGPINLAAIDEYKMASEREQYLDKQNDDLTEALQTLESAMRKIDRETRTRFKDTFEQVNSGMKKIFPRLFGGGHGYLQLTGEELLETGVSVMARPPGKRNSSIHLLSGGEKAMTAIALLFSLFQLNPAPFCMLDEIDAPLDDANVIRFCEVVSEMAADVQFIVVTHSKVTMEMTHQLMGVTMQEAGVSRLVSVDIDEALKMAS